jgi:hypothetical protein
MQAMRSLVGDSTRQLPANACWCGRMGERAGARRRCVAHDLLLLRDSAKNKDDIHNRHCFKETNHLSTAGAT